MKNNYLPIGSVVLLKGGSKKLMITGYCVIDKGNTKKVYDYCGCLYPEGVVEMNKIALFNQNQIEKLFFLGYQSDELNDYLKNLCSIIDNLHTLVDINNFKNKLSNEKNDKKE